MSELALTVNGQAATAMTAWVPNVGPWHADVDLPLGSAPLTGPVTIALGALALVGTVSDLFSGSHEGVSRIRVIAGAGGWGKDLPAKAYHNDAGVKAMAVAQDAAREAGETLGSFVPAFERLGNDFVREAGSAARALECASGPAIAWWVDYAGVTHAGVRPAAAVPSDAYHVMAYDARARMATLGTDDPSRVAVGSTISEHLDVGGTIRELQIRASESELRVIAWLGGTDGGAGKLVSLMREIAQRATDGKLFGLYRYRVVSMRAGGRVALQAARKAVGLPDLDPVSMWPGVAGVHADLTPGCEVLVQFVDGERTSPIVTHFAGVDGTGFAPVTLTIGGNDGPPAARQGDAVEVLLPPAIFSGTIGGAPATGVLTFPLVKTEGVITAGSSKVRVAS